MTSTTGIEPGALDTCVSPGTISTERARSAIHLELRELANEILEGLPLSFETAAKSCPLHRRIVRLCAAQACVFGQLITSSRRP